MGNTDGVQIGEGRITRESEKAFFVEFEDAEPVASVWVPKKCIHDDSEIFELEDEGILVVMRWWAERHELF